MGDHQAPAPSTPFTFRTTKHDSVRKKRRETPLTPRNGQPDLSLFPPHGLHSEKGETPRFAGKRETPFEERVLSHPRIFDGNDADHDPDSDATVAVMTTTKMTKMIRQRSKLVN